MKKIIAVLLAVLMMASLFTACSQKAEETPAETPAEEQETPAEETPAEEPAEEPAEAPEENAEFRVGVILDADENAGYSFAHMQGVRVALENLNLTEEANVIWKYNIPGDQACYDACVDLAESNCQLIICIGYDHQSYCQQAAEEYPEIEFINMTGDTARAAGLDNFHNAFTAIYEARYVGGIVAGMKIQEMIDNGELTDKNYDEDGNVKVGYVGAFPYAEVVSGYTAFFLGIRSVVENVSMNVIYTNSWFDITSESETATALISDGCVIIGQHADSTGAPSACEQALKAGTPVYSVGYNIDMRNVAPTAALTSPTNEWGVYYTYAIGAVLNGETFDTNWVAGYDQDAVTITELGESAAEGTMDAVNAAIEELHAGTLHVFDTSKFTVEGEEVTSAFATDTDGDWVNDADEAVFDGYFHESYYQSAPCFALRIDGITEFN